MPSAPRQTVVPPDTDAALREAAQSLEVAFLSQMFEAAGVGAVPDAFGGGAGEDQFASFLREEHARAVVARGGIGLAESLFQALRARVDG